MADRCFPLGDHRPPPRWGWRLGPRRFGARRSKGRAHAGVDLYAPDRTPVHAVADGTVIGGGRFYAGTDALVIDHGPFVARYGEVAPGSWRPLRPGDTVRSGQQIGEVGRLQGIPVPSNMLHFELYVGGLSGKLSRRNARWGTLRHPDGRPFYRRRDLVDPTPFVEAWAGGRPDPFPTLWRGHRGAAVERLQGALGIKADGDYGPKTEAAVKSYQRDRGLAPDGVAGPLTRYALPLRSL